MVGNFKMKSLNTFVKSMVSTTIFLHQEHHNKMVLLRGKIDHFRSSLELY